MEAAPRPRYPAAGLQLKAAVCLVGVPESYRKELSVRARI